VCSQGTVAGFAQVPSDVGAGWTQVDGYGHSIFTVGPIRQGYPPLCRPEPALARQVSTGVYDVSLNSSLAWACVMAAIPKGGATLPAVISVASPDELVATYQTTCDQNDKGFVERVTIHTPAGVPASAEFTVEVLEPVVVAEP
jgi:hypothetical protein